MRCVCEREALLRRSIALSSSLQGNLNFVSPTRKKDRGTKLRHPYKQSQLYKTTRIEQQNHLRWQATPGKQLRPTAHAILLPFYHSTILPFYQSTSGHSLGRISCRNQCIYVDPYAKSVTRVYLPAVQSTETLSQFVRPAVLKGARACQMHWPSTHITYNKHKAAGTSC